MRNFKKEIEESQSQCVDSLITILGDKPSIESVRFALISAWGVGCDKGVDMVESIVKKHK